MNKNEHKTIITLDTKHEKKIIQTKIQNIKQKGNKIHTKNNNRNQQSVSNLHTFSSVHCQKENYSNETKLCSCIKFNVLGSWADNKINNDMLAMLHTNTK